jgi:DNA mismatch repair protein MutS2
MSFPIGADVVVRSFGKKRGVVVAADRNGRYRVRMEGLTVSCKEWDLELPAAGSTSQGESRSKGHESGAAVRKDAAPPQRLDLHGLRVDEAMARVVGEIDRSLMRGADRLEIVHGRGTGRIKSALHRHLATMPVVKAFGLDHANPGVTWVYF